MSLVFILRGIIIGVLFGIPAGAVGTMTIRRTLEKGTKAGLITGLGSSVADCIYASIGAFGLSLISDFLLSHQKIINACGGLLVISLGIFTILKKPSEKKDTVSSGVAMFLSSFIVGITNTASILTFLFAFSYFNLSIDMNLVNGILLVCGVFIGTFLWWLLLSLATNRFRSKVLDHRMLVNRILGTLLILFGLVMIFR